MPPSAEHGPPCTREVNEGGRCYVCGVVIVTAPVGTLTYPWLTATSASSVTPPARSVDFLSDVQ
ncbi:hypothetical protein, partial [Quadrisphaera granulorum]|uniref:hypothetical protein n=1 Tax=Quadrisphaera granulorum TaxID=317664 RepID=UPI001B866D3D